MKKPPELPDVRMRGFTQRTTFAEAVRWVDDHAIALSVEYVPLSEAGGRVLAEDVISAVDVPGFARAMMDGFAVRAADTSGASPYNRLSLRVIGSAFPGRPAAVAVTAASAIRVMTGASLPAGADAVLPAEQVEIEPDRILALDEVSPGRHVGNRGEDVASGSRVLSRGRRLRPQDLGVLSSIGLAQVPVVRQPVVRLVITGNELLPAGSVPSGVCIPDSNGPMLESLVKRDGGVVLNPGIVPDRSDAVLAAIQDEADAVLVSGGSSVGEEDIAPALIRRHGSLDIHGIAMRPSSPTGMGTMGHRPVFLLPGNPVSCLCAYDMFAGRAVRLMGGRGPEWPYPSVRLPLRRKIVSLVGRYDYARVRVVEDQVEPLAISGASLLTSTTLAEGFLTIPENSEGYAAGSLVEVFLYDRP